MKISCRLLRQEEVSYNLRLRAECPASLEGSPAVVVEMVRVVVAQPDEIFGAAKNEVPEQVQFPLTGTLREHALHGACLHRLALASD